MNDVSWMLVYLKIWMHPKFADYTHFFMHLNILLCFELVSETIGLLNMQAHDLLKLYDRVDVPPERLLFKIPSTWQGSSCFVPTNLEILNCPLFYVYRRHHNMFRQFSFSSCSFILCTLLGFLPMHIILCTWNNGGLIEIAINDFGIDFMVSCMNA